MRGVLSSARLLRKAALVVTEDIGDAVNNVFTLTPANINTSRCVVEVSENSTKVIVAPKIEKDPDGSEDKVKITFDPSDIPTSNQYKVTIVGL